MPLPTLFISHGGPDIVIADSPARDFLRGYGKTLGKPRAIVIASAHFNTSRPAVVGDAHPAMIYDFAGFPRELSEMVYPAPGDPVIAVKVAGLLEAAGFAPVIAKERGFDHGTWAPLMLLYPDADVPVVQLSVQPQRDPAYHLALGRALATLREENILLIGSGSATHNLHEFFRGGHAPGEDPPEWVAQFDEWLHEKLEQGAVDDLVNYRQLAPYAAENHPTEEHLLPLFIPLGAARDRKGERVHASYANGVLAMDTYAFN
jgi:4,5-DOPA dioxygenase extradiol